MFDYDVTLYAVAPLRGRGLKRLPVQAPLPAREVAPLRGRGLKRHQAPFGGDSPRSLPYGGVD